MASSKNEINTAINVTDKKEGHAFCATASPDKQD